MSGAYPTSPAFRSVNFRSVHVVLADQAQNLRRQVRDFGGHAWRFGVQHSRLTAANFWPLYAFLLKQRGVYDTFTIVLPDKAPRGVATGTPLVNGASQSGRTINTDGWTVSTTGILKAGDILKFAGHSKVYMVTADANSNGSGQAALSIEPALLQSPADNEALTVTSVPFTVALLDNETGYTVTPPQFYELAFEVEEAL